MKDERKFKEVIHTIKGAEKDKFCRAARIERQPMSDKKFEMILGCCDGKWATVRTGRQFNTAANSYIKGGRWGFNDTIRARGKIDLHCQFGRIACQFNDAMREWGTPRKFRKMRTKRNFATR